MRLLKIILALYLIVLAGFSTAGAVMSIGETYPPVTAIQALVGILFIVPLFILGYAVIRYDGTSGNKSYEKNMESLLEKLENTAKKIDERINKVQ